MTQQILQPELLCCSLPKTKAVQWLNWGFRRLAAGRSNELHTFPAPTLSRRSMHRRQLSENIERLVYFEPPQYFSQVFTVRHLGTSPTISSQPLASLLGFLCVPQTDTSSSYLAVDSTHKLWPSGVFDCLDLKSLFRPNKLISCGLSVTMSNLLCRFAPRKTKRL